MSIYEQVLIFMGAIVALLSWASGNRRGAMWILVILADLVVSTAYWRSGMPYGDVITALCDFTVCVLIYVFGSYRFELWVMLLFMSSMAVSIVDLAAMIWAPGLIDHDTYSSMLEAINYLSFLLIGGVSGMEFLHIDSAAVRPWVSLRPSFLPLFAKRSSD